MLRTVLAVCLGAFAAHGASLTANIDVYVDSSYTDAVCVTNAANSGGPPATADAEILCDGSEGPTSLVASAYASPLEVWVSGQIDPHNYPELIWGAELSASATTTVYISGGKGTALVEFLLWGGTSTGGVVFRALGEYEDAYGTQISNPDPTPFVFGERFALFLIVGSSMYEPAGTSYADPFLRVEGIRVTDLLGNPIDDARLHVIPEPGGFILLGGGFALLAALRRKGVC